MSVTEKNPIDGRGTGPATDRDERSQLWWVIARRELAVKLTDRSFLIGTLVSLLLIVGLIGIQGFLGSRDQTYKVGVSEQAATQLADAIADQAPEVDDSIKIEVVDLSPEGAEKAVLDEDVDAWLQAPEDGGSWTLVSRDSPPGDLERVVGDVLAETTLAANAKAAGTTMADLTEGSTLKTDQLDGDAKLSQLRGILGFAFAFLFYLATIMFGMTLASSVVEEKQSRIVEMIAAAVPLRQLLAGKIIGNTILAFGQMAIYVAVGLIGLRFTEYGNIVSSLSLEVGWFLLFFLVGFVVLSCIWAVCGALAGRSEDLQHTATPVTTLLMAMFFGALFLDGTAEVVASFIPPVSAVLMPMRLIDGTAAWWEPIVAMVLLLALGAVLVGAAERIYRRALLQTGGRLSVRAAWKLED